MSVRSDAITRRANPAAILAVVLISYFMILLDNSIIFTALPSIESSMGLTASGLAWVQDAYTLVFGGLLLLGARAGDLLGRRRVFVAGLVAFVVASLLVGLAPTGWWLIGARALQGVGAAIVAPTSLALLTASFAEGQPRSRAVALYGATAGIGASVGLVIGGALAQWISWRAGFFLNVPIGLAMIVLVPRFLPETARHRGEFDLIGAVTATFGVGAVVFGIVESVEHGWTSSVTLSSLGVGVALVAGLVVAERRAREPIMPLRLFASRLRVAAYLARMLYMGAMIGFFYFGTQFLQNVLGFTAFQAGLAFLPMTAVNFVVALSIPRLTARLGQGLALALGVASTMAGIAWLARLDEASTYVTGLALPMILIGVGQGLAFAPLTSAGIAGADNRDAGAASGLVNTFHQLGMAVGLSVLVAVSAPAGQRLSAAAASLTAQVGAAFNTATVLLVVCLVVAALILAAEHRTRSADAVSAARDLAAVHT